MMQTYEVHVVTVTTGLAVAVWSLATLCTVSSQYLRILADC